jgi:hypothetical protein
MSPEELRVLEQTAIQISGIGNDEDVGDLQLTFTGGAYNGTQA